jgi:hypothetical protein
MTDAVVTGDNPERSTLFSAQRLRKLATESGQNVAHHT